MFDRENLPGWARWVAQDADGSWWAYEAEPLQQTTGWYENEVGRHLKLGTGSPQPGWPETLEKLNHQSTSPHLSREKS